MLLSTLKVQKALTVLGFDPGPVDGVYGARTATALERWGHSAGITVVRGADGTTVDIQPVALANQLASLASTYDSHVITAHPPGYVSSSTATPGTPIVEVGPAELDPAPSLPFWRSANPWAWLAVLAPTSIVLAAAGWFFMPTKRRRRRRG